MKNKPIDQLRELLVKPENMTVDRMDCLVRNTMNFFNRFIEIIKSGNKEEKEQALKELAEFKEELQVGISTIAEQTGLSQKDLPQVVNDPENFSKEQWNSMQEINEALNEFNTTIAKNFAMQDQKIVKPKTARTSRKQCLHI